MVEARIAGHVLVEQLVALGADTVFCVPGESFLGVLDGLFEHRDAIRVITNRQEGGTAMMASAYGQLTGRPGIAMVTRGPGATNASIGLHMANQDANPMLLFVGQVPLRELDRRSFQEVDYRLMYAEIAKEVVEIRDPDRVPEYVARAWRTAVTGEPGPVVVVLPEDMLRVLTCAPIVPPSPPLRPVPDARSVDAVLAALAEAERPLVVVGGTGWTDEGVAALGELVADSGLPFATAFRRQDLIDNTAGAYVGGFGPLSTTGLAELARDADVVLLLGTRPDEQTAAGWLEDAVPTARVLHVHPEPGLIGKLLPTEVGVVAGPGEFALAWRDRVSGTRQAGWQTWRERLRSNYDRVRSGAGGSAEAELAARYMAVLEEFVDETAVFTVGAGAYTFWAQRLHDYTRYRTCLGSASGAMGYGLPAAVTAKLLSPEAEVVAFAGDGCFLMNGQELATAVQNKLGLTVIVINNEVYGVIRNHQRREFPGRPVATVLANPDFAALARAYGAFGATVTAPEDFADAWRSRPTDGTPSLIEIRVPYDE
ncbi:thiamine pyrophosphate-dependent enzyme [Ammonicoccus fulvus]|uniref:Thiamine pyrophosphate-dependent enzyme n=1 Tax=Ammonicoccus fulvus TaxID=3138240 RepID=A0ABZ3FR26_9ACTN